LFALQVKVPPVGDTLVAQSPVVVDAGAVGPRAKSVSVQLTLTVGVTVAGAWGAGDALGQPLPPHIWPVYTVVPRYVAVMVADPTETPVTCPELLTVITEVLLLLQEEGPKE